MFKYFSLLLLFQYSLANAELIDIGIDLLIDEKEQPQQFIKLDIETAKPFFNGKKLYQLLNPFLNKHYQQQLKKQLLKKIDFKMLKNTGLNTSYNADLFLLKINIPPLWKPIVKKKIKYTMAKGTFPKHTSYLANIQIDANNLKRSQLISDFYIAKENDLYHYKLQIQQKNQQNTPQFYWLRKENSLKQQAGYLNFPSPSGVSVPTVYGYLYQKGFELDAEQRARLLPDLKLSLDEDSSIQIWSENLLVWTGILNAGNHLLTSLPLPNGVHNLRIIVKGKSGKEQILNQYYSINDQKIASQTHQYAISAGTNVNNQKPVIAYRHKYGLSKKMTLGGYLISNDTTVTIGGEIITDALGGLVSMGYFNNGTSNIWANYSNQSGIGSLSSYLSISSDIEKRPILNIRYSRPITSDDYVSGGIQSATDSSSMYLDWRRRFNQQLSLNASLNSNLTTNNNSISFNFNWRPTLQQTVYGQFKKDSSTLGYLKSPKPRSYPWRNTWSIQSQKQNSNNNLAFNSSWDHTSYGRISTRINKNSQTDTDLTISTFFAIGSINNQVALGPTASNSWAIIDGEEQEKNIDVLISGNKVGEFSDRPILLTNIINDFPNSVTLDTHNLSYDKIPSPSQWSLQGKNKHGHLLKIKVEKKILLFAKIIYPNNQAVSYQSVFLYPKHDSNNPIRTFSGKSGNIFIEGIEPGIYTITVSKDGQTFSKKTTILNQGNAIKRLGTLILEADF